MESGGYDILVFLICLNRLVGNIIIIKNYKNESNLASKFLFIIILRIGILLEKNLMDDIEYLLSS